MPALKLPTLILVVMLMVCHLPTALGSASLTVNLEKLIEEANRTSLIPVIVKFKDQVDITTLRGEVSQQLQYANGGFDTRKRQQRLLRNKIVTGLKESSHKTRRTLATLLHKYGVDANLKSLWSINAVALKLPAHLVDEVAALPGIERISLDLQLSMNASSTDAVTAEPLWNLYNVKTNYLWQMGYAGDGVVVAIMDSGVDLNHPDLVDRWRGGDNSWFDPYGQNALPVDLNGHGTQSLSLILGGDASGYQLGMAPHAQWIAARLFDDADQASLSAIHEAFQWLLDPDGDPTTNDAPDVVNNSWGFSNTINQCYQEFSDDIRLLREAGIVVVFSAGNYGPYDETSISPANDPGALSVGSVDQFNDIDTFSSRGPGACDGGVFPKLVAPGSLVYTADRLPVAYNVVSGTSFAAPHVTGAIALLKSAFPMATVTQIETALLDSATDLGSRGADDQFGYGMLDVAAAYDLLYKDLGSDSPGMLAFSETLYSVDETTDKLIVNVRRLGGSAGEVTVDYETVDGQAVSSRPADFTATSGTLRFVDGETLRSFEIPIVNDDLDEDNETFYISLSNPTGGALLSSRPQVPATILDDDGPGSISFGAVSYAVNESHETASITLIRSGGTTGAISADISLASDTAQLDSDFFEPAETTIRFADGEVSKVVEIPLVDDGIHEANETFKVLIANTGGGAGIGKPATTTVTILDDDPDTSITTIHLDAVNYFIRENGGKVTLSVVRSGNLERMASVDFTTADGSARSGKDYQTTKGRLTFRPKVKRRTIEIPIINDGIYEKESSFTVVLTAVDSGSQLAKPEAAIVRIGNDDPLPNVSLGTSGSKGVTSQINGAFASDIGSFGSTDTGQQQPATSDRQTGGAVLKIFDLTLRGYNGIGEDDLKRFQTLGGNLEPPAESQAETKTDDTTEPDTTCDEDSSLDECKKAKTHGGTQTARTPADGNGTQPQTQISGSHEAPAATLEQHIQKEPNTKPE
jgi:subtilisin family serine protease